MSTRVVRRAPRRPAPRLPGGELPMEPPPEPAKPVPAGLGQKLMPALMILGSVGFIVVMGMQNPSSPTSWVFGGIFALSTIGMMAGGMGRGGSQRAETDENRRDYLRYLAQVRRRIREVAARQRASLEWTHPDPAALLGLLQSDRLWERRDTDPDFAQLRVGRGRQRLATRLVAPQTGPLDELEPVCAWALRRLLRAHAVVPDLPVAVAFGALRRVSLHPLAGPHGRAPALELARAVLAQYTVWHSPANALVAVIASPAAMPHWDWVKWLPHAQHPALTDQIGALRMVSSAPGDVLDWLTAIPGGGTEGAARLLVVVDGVDVRRAGAQWLDRPEVTVLRVAELPTSPTTATEGVPAGGERGELALLVDAERLGAGVQTGRGPVDTRWIGRPDGLGLAEASVLARRMARFRAPRESEPDTGRPLRGTVGLPELLGIDDPATVALARARWRDSPVDRLRVPIGIGEHGEPVLLDIKESAQGGSGPHGLCIGATGSGKSELLRTLLLGLVATHPSDELNLVLIDFKGGATFLGMAGLPHVSAVITNLADELSLVDRMADALAGEINRRQELLRKAGNFASVADYERHRRTAPRTGAGLPPLPALFIVVDEFSEMLAQRPELVDLMVTIGRLGRSLQMHLLLASQRLDEGRLRGLESHLSYRIGLRTFSPAESRAVLGVPDAYNLPPMPGSGYLALGTDELVRFRAAYVSGPRAATAGPASVAGAPRRPVAFSSTRVGPDPRERDSEPTLVFDGALVLADGSPGTGAFPVSSGPANAPNAPSVMDEMVTALIGQGPPAHPVWLPPLEEPPALDTLLPALGRGPRGLGTQAPGELRLALGLIDRPFHQRWDPLWVDLSGAAGHGVVVGAPQSGKSTVLRTLMLGLALSHTPRELSMYALDFGGGMLAALSGLPHCGGVADRQQPDQVRRTVAELTALLADRERSFRAAGIDSAAEFRRRKARGEFADPHGDVLLVVDGYLTLRSEYEELEQQLLPLATRGLSYGIHLVVSANRWTELRPALKDLLGTRVELRLGDPSDSDFDRRRAASVPAKPGHGLTADGAQCVIARPMIDTLGDDLAATVAALADAWEEPPVPSVRLLPDRIDYSEVLALAGSGSPHVLPIGVDEARLEPVLLDFDADPHLICLADDESGKTNLLRVLAGGVVRGLDPERARIVLVDYRRTLLGQVPDSHLIGYASGAKVAAEVVRDIADSLRRRLPGPDVTPARLRDRSWWSGPELYLLVDDYDLVAGAGAGAAGSANPLLPLMEFLPQAKDVGLHLVLARRCGGVGRAMFEPVFSRLRELATPGLMMSGPPDEGPILDGLRPEPLPPGRGVLVGRRYGKRRMQVAWYEPDLEGPGDGG
ncbi:type VII secretion protein EccC [Pseudonocardia eucalypti]|uniref:Type VII secretion protein EccC n=1 Tax=Pseudonocardia eucalypti TaxID=648755 RepID=A0ABP9PI57_9PSEU|nr:S-DNA-T family DNA segregation ATPase FtsK/SpoIIIE [Pseudonocardia eucalypti]